MIEPNIILTAKKYGPLILEETPNILSVKGVFRHGIIAIGNNERQLIYITNKDHPGPFTIYVPGFQTLINQINTQLTLTIEDQLINIPDLKVVINLKMAIPFPRFTKVQPNDLKHIHVSLLSVKNSLLELKNFNSDFLTSYLSLFPLKSIEKPHYQAEEHVRSVIKDFYKFLIYRNETGLQSTICQCIGLGNGLTPAGDDFLAGWLLTNFLYQGGDNLMPFHESISKFIIEIAPLRTHLLSSGLIWAASRGESDPILRQVVNNIMQGKHVTSNELHDLTAIGHTSGFDGLSGSLIYLESLLPSQMSYSS